MSPILGIIASQNYPRITSSYESIATVTVGSGGQASITFSSIPATYTHLQVRIMHKAAGASTTFVNMNGDTTANYNYHYGLYGSGATVGSGGYSASQAKINVLYTESSVYQAVAVLDILDYANTNKYKTTRSLSGYDANGSGYVFYDSGAWRSVNAITSLVFTNDDGTFPQYSSFALYGIKGS